jgi:hypothetical protein
VADLAALTNFPSEEPPLPPARPEVVVVGPSLVASVAAPVDEPVVERDVTPLPFTESDGDRMPRRFEFVTTQPSAWLQVRPSSAPQEPPPAVQLAWSRVPDDRPARMVSLYVAVALGVVAIGEAAVIAFLAVRIFAP